MVLLEGIEPPPLAYKTRPLPLRLKEHCISFSETEESFLFRTRVILI
jgi:hypothetical protein